MLDNWFYVIPSIFFGTLLLLAIRQSKKKNYLPIFVVILYFLSSCMIWLAKPNEWYPYFHKSSYTPFSFLVYSIYISIFLYPALYLRPIPKKFFIPRTRALTSLMWIVSLLGLYSIVYLLPYAIESLQRSADEIRVLINTTDIYTVPPTLFTTFAVGIAYFYLFYIALFFIAVIQRQPFYLCLGVFIASLSNIISGLTIASRDVFVFYFFCLLFVYLYFYNLIPIRILRKIKIKIFILIIILLGFISNITYQRFNQDSLHSLSLAAGSVGYFTQQPFVFSEVIAMQDFFYGGNLRFPVFMSIIGKSHEIIRTYHYETSFGTFITSFYAEGGFLFLSITSFFFFLIFYNSIRTFYKKSFYQNLIIALFYFQFINTGLFYFKLGTRAGNLYMIILLVIYILVSIRPQSRL